MLLEVIYGKVKFSGEETSGFSTRGLANLWHTCQQWHAERFAWHAAFTAVPFFFFIMPDQHLCIV
jgi:hypothetical protein